VPLQDPFAGVAFRTRRLLGEDVDPAPLLEFWESRAPGNPRGEMRYRWDLSHRHSGPRPSHVPPPEQWRAWRPTEQSLLERDPFAFEERLATPILLTENLALLAEAAESGSALAAMLLNETVPTFRRDFARYVQALDPWEDTFALSCLVRHPAVLALAYPVAVAIASSYGAMPTREDGALLGLRFPFHLKPLVSASAYLATSLMVLGIDLDVAARLASYAASARRPDGLWGDEPENADILATLAAGELLVGLEPSFHLGGTAKLLGHLRTDLGLFRAIGPESIWLTARMSELLRLSDTPFSSRFRWPHRAAHGRDLKTGLPSFSYFADLTRFFGAVPWLSAAPVEIAFIDLIGFRAFNNRFGQQRGDDVLRGFADELGKVPDTRVVRDGGDEFLVVGAPTRGGLADDLAAFRKGWPPRFRALFGDASVVAPRIVVGRTTGSGLGAAREVAGRAITELKDAAGVGEEGISKDLGRI